MQLDPRFQERIAVIVTVIVGILGAIMLGKMTAQGQTSLIAAIAGGAFAIASLLHFRERVWVVIPVLWPFYGAVQILPLPFALKDIGVMLAFGAVVVCIALKIVRLRPTFTLLDALFYLNAIWLLVAFIRNPVGYFASDSERVGGRPYVSAFFGFIAYWVLSRLTASPEMLRRVPMYAVGALVVFCGINVVIMLVPAVAPFAAQFYAGFNFDFVDQTSLEGAGNGLSDDGTARIELFRDIGKYSCIFLCSYFFPPTLFNPLKWKRSLAFIGTILGLLLSGFRSFLGYAGAVFLLGSFFRAGWRSVMRAAGIGILALYILMLGHGTVYRLPFSAQRALAIVPEVLRPTTLDELAVLSGESSTNWRVEMWIQALTTNRYISDKWFGDGFGMDRMQINAFQKAVSRGQITNFESQEQMAIAGDFHSGPVSAIRVVGVVGLVFVYLLYIPLAFHAARLIRRTKGTPFFEPTMFFCIPIVFELFWYTFVFGGHPAVIPFAGTSLGIMKLIENSLAAWGSQSSRKDSLAGREGTTKLVGLPA